VEKQNAEGTTYKLSVVDSQHQIHQIHQDTQLIFQIVHKLIDYTNSFPWVMEFSCIQRIKVFLDFFFAAKISLSLEEFHSKLPG